MATTGGVPFLVTAATATRAASGITLNAENVGNMTTKKKSSKKQNFNEMDADDQLKMVRNHIVQAMEDITNICFAPGAICTFIMRMPGNVDAEMMVTPEENLDDVAAVIARFKARGVK